MAQERIQFPGATSVQFSHANLEVQRQRKWRRYQRENGMASNREEIVFFDERLTEEFDTDYAADAVRWHTRDVSES